MIYLKEKKINWVYSEPNLLFFKTVVMSVFP